MRRGTKGQSVKGNILPVVFFPDDAEMVPER
jgi:hypothetical protein